MLAEDDAGEIIRIKTFPEKPTSIVRTLAKLKHLMTSSSKMSSCVIYISEECVDYRARICGTDQFV